MISTSVGNARTELDKLKVELEDSDANIFERLAADLFSRLIGDVSVSVSKPGSQFGGDAGTAGLRGRHLRVECKRYRETTRLDPRGLAGEVMESLLKDNLIEAWLLVATKEVSETEQNLARDAGAELGVPIVVIDWTSPPSGVGINRLASLCGTWPDVVEQHLGRTAADAARSLKPYVGATVDNLRRDLECWHIGFENLRTASVKYVKRVWEDSAESKAALNQDAAGGRVGVHLIERVGPHRQLSGWWLKPADVRTPAVVTGTEGVGKTWVALDWATRNCDALPIIVLLGANEFVNGSYLNEKGVKDLLGRSLRGMTKSTLGNEYWRIRLERLLGRPASEGATFLLLVDGLNQQPHFNWDSLAKALQGEGLAGKVRLLATTRRSYFETDLRRLTTLHTRPAQVEVGPYDHNEFDKLLGLHGMSRKDLHPALISLACMPRLFPLVLRLKDNVALQSEASVPRLLFEYGRDILQLRQNSTLTDDEWVGWLVERAKVYRQELEVTGKVNHPTTAKELAASVDAPHFSKEEVARRLSDVIDGKFFRVINTPTGTKHILEQQSAILGLGLALLDSLSPLQGASFETMQCELEKWLEPVAAIDEVVYVVRASLAVLSAVSNTDGTLVTDVLLTAWMNAQNPSRGFVQDVEVFGDSFPRSMLCVVEKSTLQSRATAFHLAVQSLRRLPRSRVDDWSVIQERMLEWCSWVNLPRLEDVADPKHYANDHQAKLMHRIGTVAPGSVLVLGERLMLAYSHVGEPDAAVPSILEGHELSEFMPVFRRAAVREAVQVHLRGHCWPGLKWLVLVASRDEVRGRTALSQLADEVLAAAPEPGVHERLRNRAAALLMRATGEEPLEIKARSIDERFEEGWYYERDYLKDPAASYFPLEYRHVQTVLTNKAVLPGRRLDRLGVLLAHPQVKLPAELSQGIADALQHQKFQNINTLGQTTEEEHHYERLELLGARFAPLELVQATSRRLEELASRQDEQKYWAALAAPELVLAACAAEGERFSGLRMRSKLALHENHANTWCLQLELLHKSLPEQLSVLLSAEDFYYTTDLMAVVRTATAPQLRDFLYSNASSPEKAARVILEVMAYKLPENAGELAQELTTYLWSDVDEVKAIAFVALSGCAAEVCGLELMAKNWKPASEDSFIAHHGSRAVVKASSHLAFEDVLPHIAPWQWLDAALLRGGKPKELEEASRRLLTVLKAPADSLPEVKGDFTLRNLDTGDMPSVSVQERPASDVDELSGGLKSLAEGIEEANKRRQELAKHAVASIQAIRTGGYSLYLHSFSKDSLKAAYEAAPALWQEALEGVQEVSCDFVNRVRSAEGLYVTLCEVLLECVPALGASLWRALRVSLRTQFQGAAGISELMHIAFRTTESGEVLSLRQDITSLMHCNTDQHLMELVIVAQLNGQDAWLERLTADDANSDVLWRRKRAIVVSALSATPDISELHWPEGEKTGTWEALREHMTRWTSQGTFAIYWWRKFATATDVTEAFAAWHVFLSCADRRAHVWMKEIADAADKGSELDRLRKVQLELNRDVFKRALKKREDRNPDLTDHLFGNDAPSKWLTLDGVKH